MEGIENGRRGEEQKEKKEKETEPKGELSAAFTLFMDPGIRECLSMTLSELWNGILASKRGTEPLSSHLILISY